MPNIKILQLLLQLHVGLFLYRVVPDMHVCDHVAFGGHTDADLTTAMSRASQSWYALVFALESVVMITIVFIFWLTKSLPRPAKLLPALLVISALSVRARHAGILGCAYGDTECCSNMYCTQDGRTYIPGSNITAALFQFSKRETYCPEPSWYDIAFSVDGFGALPDIAKCYEYGCSALHTPVTYYGGRLEFAVVALFGVFCITS